MELTDLRIIQQLYFRDAKKILLFDPDHQVIGEVDKTVNLMKQVSSNNMLTELLQANNKETYVVFNLSKSKSTFDWSQHQIENVVHFNQNNTANSGIKHHFINNPNGTIRWIFPSTNQSAVFLSLYNNSGWKAKLYKSVMKIATSLGIEKYFSQGYFTFEKMTTEMYDFLPNQYHDDYAIFTGTAGENRKAIVAIAANNYVNSFVKIPLTEKAKHLVKNEKRQLEYIKQIDLRKMGTPKCTGSVEQLQLTNIKPIRTVKQSSLSNHHLAGIAEFYSKTVQHTSLQSTIAWSEIQGNMQMLNNEFELKNNLDKNKLTKIIHQLNLLVDRIGAESAMPVGLAHGDFTPWNMYLTDEKIYVYDWEMSRRDMPLLFDIFHYIFQSNILIKQGDLESIKKEIEIVRQNEIVQDMVTANSIDWSLHYAFYLSYVASYYLPLYIYQQDLHMQAHWLVDVWAEALDSFSFVESERELERV